MAFQLVSFPQRSDRVFDWTRDELAELYRIEHALAQANIRLETDRGLSDEGDPWFVFCRTDGEVLVHISRYDGQYQLSSPGLANSLVGRSFAELTKSFVRQVPVQVSLQQRDGAKLFVHPAAMLAVIVGTIFAASNDLHLFSSRSETGQHTDDAYDRGNLKHTLQATFASYIETFFSSLRDASIFQPSSYLALISGVAAFIIESTVGITDHSPNEFANANIMANGTRPTDGASQHDNAPSVADNQVSGHKIATNENSTAITTPETVAQQDAGNDGNANATNVMLAVNGGQLANFHVAENDGALSAKAIENVLNVNDFSAEDTAGHIAQPAMFVPILSSLNSSNFGSYTTNVTHSGVGPDLSQSNASPQTSGFNSDVVGLLTNALNSPNENLQLNTIFSNIGHVVTDIATVTAAANIVASSINASAGTQLPTFNAAAEATLIAFFEANPNPQTVFYNGNIIVSDGIQNPSDPVIVKIWEVGTSGETIAIVGHADHGLTA
jgi:hypothetical protein